MGNDQPIHVPTEKKPSATDVYVGRRIRLRRNLLRVSQESLAEAIGVTFQQVQKYEHGTNRVSASRLQAIAEALGVGIEFFFENLPRASPRFSRRVDTSLLEFSASDEGFRLNKAFTKIASTLMRRRIIELVESIASLNR